MFTAGDHITLNQDGVLKFPRLEARDWGPYSADFHGCCVDRQLAILFAWMLRHELEYNVTALTSIEAPGFALRVDGLFNPRFRDQPEQYLEIRHSQLGFLQSYGEPEHCHFDFEARKCLCDPTLRHDLLHYVDANKLGLKVLSAILTRILGVPVTLETSEAHRLIWTFTLQPDMYQPRLPRLTIGEGGLK